MAELGFMESLALGMIAGRSGPGLAETGVGVLHDLRHKQALAQAEPTTPLSSISTIASLTAITSFTVTRRNLEDENARQSEQNDALSQGLAAANARVTTLEQWGNDLAVHEAQARHDAELLQGVPQSNGQYGHSGRNEAARGTGRNRPPSGDYRQHDEGPGRPAAVGRLRHLIPSHSRPDQR